MFAEEVGDALRNREIQNGVATMKSSIIIFACAIFKCENERTNDHKLHF